MATSPIQPAGRRLGPANRDRKTARREPLPTQLASFVDLFVWLLLLKSFFIPLFVIPTGSMAETLMGAHSRATCTNCAFEFPIGPEPVEGLPRLPETILCPNCMWAMRNAPAARGGDVSLKERIGDRIIVHGWNYELGGALGPKRWDVVVFKNPNQPQENYIKRLVGLPGETLRIADGDVFVSTKDDPTPRIVSKNSQAQAALWHTAYDHNYRPAQPSNVVAGHQPRWIPVDSDSAWRDVDQRAVIFDGRESSRQSIQFVTRSGGALDPGWITDVYGYNARPGNAMVNDVRLSVDVETLDGDGRLELSLARAEGPRFIARLTSGRVSLERVAENGDRISVAAADVRPPIPGRPLGLALAHVDGVFRVEVDRRRVLETSPADYTITYEQALRAEQEQIQGRRRPPRLRISAERVHARLRNLRIERDVFYLAHMGVTPIPHGSHENPITLSPSEYFVMGDNSPSSQDGRLWTADMLSANLRERRERGQYTLGSVPADHMIGRAFFVYWPGFIPAWDGELQALPSGGLMGLLRSGTFVPDFGRVRWIH